MSAPHFAALDAAGLNLQAVFEFSALPADVRAGVAACAPGTTYRQLILIANAGPAMWAALQAARVPGPDPMDDYSRTTVEAWCRDAPGNPHRLLLYPGDAPLGLQRLGELAGWHHPSPFMVGIQPGWGSWFGYRVALLADTALPPTPRVEAPSPCASCSDRPCVAACPGAALAPVFSLDACLDWRLRPCSSCAETCLARLACPVGAEHRYPEAQIRHSYGGSLAMIRHCREAAVPGAPAAT